MGEEKSEGKGKKGKVASDEVGRDPFGMTEEGLRERQAYKVGSRLRGWCLLTYGGGRSDAWWLLSGHYPTYMGICCALRPKHGALNHTISILYPVL